VRRAPRTKAADTPIAEPKRWRILLGPVDEHDLTAQEQWLRMFDRRTSGLARKAHPLVWRDLVARKLESESEGAWTGREPPLTRDAVLALTLRVQDWIVSAPAAMQSAPARRALKALYRVVREVEDDRNEVLLVLSGAASEAHEDRVRFTRANLRRLFGDRASHVSDDVISAAVAGWIPTRPGEAPHAKWKHVGALLGALGFDRGEQESIKRTWRAVHRKRKATPEM